MEDRVDYYELASKMRGDIINAAINLELVIDQYIANHFTLDTTKNKELKDLLIWETRMGLTRKSIILRHIITTHDTDLLKAQPTLLDDLQKIIECRNKLAHRYLDITRPSINKKNTDNKITFNQNKPLPIEYTIDQIKEITDKANKCTAALMYWHPYKIWETAFPS